MKSWGKRFTRRGKNKFAFIDEQKDDPYGWGTE